MICKIFVLSVLVAVASAQTIISRAQWGARAPTSITTMATPVPNVIIHHSEGSSCTTQTACTSVVKGIQNYHMDTNGWADIGYNFLVGGDGLVYEGRGWTRVGAHAPNYNSNSIGICFLGSFMTSNPNAAAINAAQALIRTGISLGRITSTYTLRGHRDVTATDCPGNSLYNLIKTWSNFGK